MAEQAGLGGMRWSSPLQRNIADMIQRGQTGLYGEAMGRQFESQEAAKQRMLQAMGMMSEIGAGQAQAGAAGAGLNMQAAQNLFGWGSAENELAMSLAGQLGGFGQGQFGMEQAQYGDIYNPPWMQQGQGVLGQAGGGYPATYQPSIWENLAGAASYLPGIVGAFGGGGGQQLPAGRTFGNLPFTTPQDMPYG